MDGATTLRPDVDNEPGPNGRDLRRAASAPGARPLAMREARLPTNKPTSSRTASYLVTKRCLPIGSAAPGMPFSRNDAEQNMAKRE